jgi:diacylglycerol kinase
MNRFRKHIRSYIYSIRGLRQAFLHENNLHFHIAAAIAVIVMNTTLRVSQAEWLITLMLIGLAWTAELFNTAIEKLADRVTKDYDPSIGQVKDMASGAVLIICFFAVICALIIYVPYLLTVAGIDLKELGNIMLREEAVEIMLRQIEENKVA